MTVAALPSLYDGEARAAAAAEDGGYETLVRDVWV